MRGHEWRLAKDEFHTDIRKCFLSQRAVTVQNSWDWDMQAERLGAFKARLDTVLCYLAFRKPVH